MPSAALISQPPPPPHPLFTRRKTTTATSVVSFSNLPQNPDPDPNLNPSPSPLKLNLPQQLTSIASKGDESSLSGSDVLQALQRAAAINKKKKMKKNSTRRNKGGGDAIAARGEGFDSGNVRPINVRREWKERIDELERKVEELKSQYHY